MKSVTNNTHASHGMPTGDTHALKITGWLTGIYFIIELGIGFWSGSVSVMSDAFHTFSAVGGILIALVAGYYSSRPASQYATFGLIRSEIIGALFNGLFLLLMALFVFWMGYQRLHTPIKIPTEPMLWAATGGLLIEVYALWLLFGKQKDNLNMEGAVWHIIQTFVGSIIIIIAAVVIKYTGFYQIDPILGMLFGVVLFWASWGIIKKATDILLQTVPKDFDLSEMVQTLEALPHVKDIHHAHVWALTTGKNIVSMHVLVDDSIDQKSLQMEIYKILKKEFSVYFSTIQIETACLEEGKASDIDIKINKEKNIKENHENHKH